MTTSTLSADPVPIHLTPAAVWRLGGNFEGSSNRTWKVEAADSTG